MRRFDVILFGATGFTGGLVAEYLARTYGSSLTWALAGRSRERLEGTRARLAQLAPDTASLELLVADSADPASLAAVAREARVVCTTVGPYLRLGAALASACAEQGTHYCDLTGEVPFVRQSIDANHARARESGARIVHCCGFDSIPSDLGVWMLGEHFRARGAPLASAAGYFGPLRGGFSGGTIASMLGLLEGAKREPALRRLMGDPYALMPDRKADRGPDRGDRNGLAFDRTIGEWTAPFVMSSVNTRVVRRSNALEGWPYGRGFSYREMASCGAGPRGLALATAITAATASFVAIALTGPGRRVLGRVVAGPGEGPSDAARAAGSFRLRVVGESATAKGEAPRRATAVVEGTSDPGYGETAKMLGESAVCLARDETTLPAISGVLTPAAAMGEALVARLRGAGMVLRVHDPR